MRRIVIKIGTNLLTRPNGKLDYNLIQDLTDQISILHQENQIILVSSGAVGSGLGIVDFAKEKDPLIKKQMLASIGQGRLFQTYANFFGQNGVVIAQTLLTRENFRVKKSFMNIKNTLEGLLKNEVIPIANENDVVCTHETTFGDNDQLSALTASLMDADRLIILSDIQGLFNTDPKKDPNATLISEVDEISEDIIAHCVDTLSTGGTGGMYSKIKAAEIATMHGIPTFVSYGREENVLIDIMREQRKGTLFKPRKKKKFRAREAWLKTSAQVEGRIVIDQGAVEALKKNKSLLAVGVSKVIGSFRKNATVMIEDQNHIRIGVGISREDSLTVAEMAQGDVHGKVVLHKDNLFLL